MEPLKENPSTYIVQDRSNIDEMHRLDIQDKMLTTGMGGPLLELDDPTTLRRVLDVGCGTGGWLIETARAYPTIERLVGGDISGKILAYARTQADRADLGKRVQFKTMDALRVIEFPAGSFDLVNHRLGSSWLRTWDWRKILVEYRRVCRPGGMVRITEMNSLIESNSLALTQLLNISLEAFYRSGRLFTLTGDGITSHLVGLVTQHGFEDVQSRTHTIVLRAGTFDGESFYHDIAIAYRVAVPFFQKWGSLPSNYQEIYQQALHEIRAADFVATWTLVTVWGTRPRDGGQVQMRGLQ